jgi:hypothetical protein
MKIHQSMMLLHNVLYVTLRGSVSVPAPVKALRRSDLASRLIAAAPCTSPAARFLFADRPPCEPSPVPILPSLLRIKKPLSLTPLSCKNRQLFSLREVPVGKHKFAGLFGISSSSSSSSEGSPSFYQDYYCYSLSCGCQEPVQVRR